MKRLLILLCALPLLDVAPLSAQPHFTESFLLPIPAAAPEPALLTDSEICDPRSARVIAQRDGFVALWLDDRSSIRPSAPSLRFYDPQGAAASSQLDVPASAVGSPLIAAGSTRGFVTVFDFPSDFPHSASFHTSLASDLQPLARIDLPDQGEGLEQLVAEGSGSYLLLEKGHPFATRFGSRGTRNLVDLRSNYGDVNRLLVRDLPGEDGLWHAYLTNLPVSPPAFGVMVQPREADGTPAGDFLVDLTESGVASKMAVAQDGQGRIAVVWVNDSSDRVRLLRADASGLLGEPMTVASGFPVGEIFVTSDREGNLLVTFEDRSPGPGAPDRSVVRGRSVLADGTFAGPVVAVATPGVRPGWVSFAGGASTLAAPGLAQVVVDAKRGTDGSSQPGLPPRCEPGGPVLAIPTPLAGERHLLLRQGRFRVEVAWQDPFNGGEGFGHAVPGTEDAGSFWFFAPKNKEIEVKVLDGRIVNGGFWVFAAGLSNVGYQITVTDQRTGLSKTYDNPPREFGNFIDTTSFPDSVTATAAVLAASSPTPGDAPAVFVPGLEVSGNRLDGPAACAPYRPSLARTPDGFVAAYANQLAQIFRGYGTQRSASAPEQRPLSQGDEQVVATAPNGSGMMVYRESGLGQTFAQGFDASGRFGGLPLSLGTIPSTSGEFGLQLGLLRLDDGTYLLTTNEFGQEAIRFTPGGIVDTFLLDSPAVVPSADMVQVGNELWLATTYAFVTSPPSAGVFLTRYGLDGTAKEDFFFRLAEPGHIYDIELVVDDRDRAALVWAATGGIRVQRFSPDGTPDGASATLAPAGIVEIREGLAVANDPEGNLLVTWRTPARGATPHRLLSRPVLADNTLPEPATLLAVLPAETNVSAFDQAVVVSSASVGTVAVSVPKQLAEPLDACPRTLGLFALPQRLGGDRALLLREGRFRVEVDWQDPFNGGDGIGHSVPGTENAGSFWFFDRRTKEIEVKILDGRALNGHFWVFAAGLSNVGYQIHITDQRTGRTKTYVNPPRDYGNFIDTTFFGG